MGNFVKQNPQTYADILNSHIANNTVEHKRTIVRTIQIMGIFDEDADSDNYLDNEEIVDTPVVNKIIDLTNSETDTTTETDSVQINMISTTKRDTDEILSLSHKITTSKYKVVPVNIHSIEDDKLDRMSYDADLYDGNIASYNVTKDTSTKQSIPELNKLSLYDINCFISNNKTIHHK